MVGVSFSAGWTPYGKHYAYSGIPLAPTNLRTCGSPHKGSEAAWDSTDSFKFSRWPSKLSFSSQIRRAGPSTLDREDGTNTPKSRRLPVGSLAKQHVCLASHETDKCLVLLVNELMRYYVFALIIGYRNFSSTIIFIIEYSPRRFGPDLFRES